MEGLSASFTTDAHLHVRLTNEITNRRSVAVALLQGGTTLFGGSDPGFSLETPVVLGCVAKCLTATLLAQAVESSPLVTADRVADVLRAGSAQARTVLAGVEVGHLMNHTHGLDDADVDIDAVPRRADGTIDVDALCSRLAAAPRIGEPGKMYSYGGAGAWLAAAVLEERHGCTYLELLRRDLLDPLGIETDSAVEPRDACPAWGGRLALSAVDLIRFLHPHVGEGVDEAASSLEPLRGGGIGMPGWGPWQRSATRGWNLYGDDWLGHNGNRDGTGIALRFHRTEPLGIVVTSPKEADCFFALATLFGDILEEYSADYVRFPRALDPDAWAGKHRERLLGDYDNARWRVNVAESPRAGFLRLRVFDRRVPLSGSILERHLRAAENDVFFAVPPGIDYPFVQFVGEDPASGHAAYFWNGRQLWRFVR